MNITLQPSDPMPSRSVHDLFGFSSSFIPQSQSLYDFDIMNSSSYGGGTLGYSDTIGPQLCDTLIYNRDQDPSTWSHLTFFCIQMLDSDGLLVSFIDYYFLHAFKTLPFFSEDWLNDHLADIPIYLLHLMYAFCLTCPTPFQVSLSAYRHYQYAMKLIHQDLEIADPFTICALLHATHFVKFLRLPCGFIHYSLAIKIGMLIKIYDPSISWISPVGNVIHLPHLTMGMWFAMYSLDFAGTQVFDAPLLIDMEISEEMVKEFSLPDNSKHTFGLLETYEKSTDILGICPYTNIKSH
jgi:hypothetical protein